MITFVTGGARSGKSSYALAEALKLSKAPVYIATARVWDKEFEQRVNRHKDERGPEWTSYETYKNLAALPIAQSTVVIDCVTNWLASLTVEIKNDYEQCLEVFKKEIDELAALDATIFIISNEIGMGVHAATEAGRKFTDLQGWANQYAAAKAGNVVFMISGIAVKIKAT